jgi:hypothetical protein
LFNILVVFLSDFQIIIFLILSWCFPSIFQQFNIFILKKTKKNISILIEITFKN